MRLHELRGLPVVDPVTARTLGTVCDVRLDAVAGHLAAVEVAGDSGSTLVPVQAIRRVGSHAIMLTGQPWQAAAGVGQDGWLDLGAFVTLSVLDEAGSLVGRLADAQVDRDTLEVYDYRLRASFLLRLLGRPGRRLALPVLSCSRQVMVVGGSRADAVARLKPEDGPATAGPPAPPSAAGTAGPTGSFAGPGRR